MKLISATNKKTHETWAGQFLKYNKPILKPVPETFYSKAIFNPTIIKRRGRIYMLFRASSRKNKTEIGLAVSKDGIHFKVRPNPVLSSEYNYEKHGCEDPRVVKFGRTYYMLYVGMSGKYNQSQICMATSKDLINWEKHGRILSDRRLKWSRGNKKAAVIVPKKIKGEYVMYFLGEQRPWQTAIGIAYSDDLINWHKKRKNKPIVFPRKDHFDSLGVEPGPTPVITRKGIMLFYNGWDENKTHRTGAVLFSKKDPSKILKRTTHPILEPTKDWEKANQNIKIDVTFAEGLAKIKNKYYIYYGAADTYIGLAVSKK